MKRAPELRDLSEDHHHGLVLARKAKSAGGAAEASSTSEVWTEVERRFEAELDLHFRIEETLIGAVLETMGEDRLVGRLHEEHAALRRLVARGSGRSPAELRRFGELLEKHIRFEERELFEVAQSRLGADALGAVAKACRERRVERRGS